MDLWRNSKPNLISFINNVSYFLVNLHTSANEKATVYREISINKVSYLSSTHCIRSIFSRVRVNTKPDFDFENISSAEKDVQPFIALSEDNDVINFWPIGIYFNVPRLVGTLISSRNANKLSNSWLNVFLIFVSYLCSIFSSTKGKTTVQEQMPK